MFSITVLRVLKYTICVIVYCDVVNVQLRFNFSDQIIKYILNHEDGGAGARRYLPLTGVRQHTPEPWTGATASTVTCAISHVVSEPFGPAVPHAARLVSRQAV